MRINFKAIGSAIANVTPKSVVSGVVSGVKAVGHGSKVAVVSVTRITDVRVNNPFHMAVEQDETVVENIKA